MLRITLTGTALIVALNALSAFGQTVTTAESGPYAALPAGQQKIVDSLYQSQSRAMTQYDETNPASPVPWSKNDIAVAKSQTGWGQVFKSMQSQGLIAERNLGQVISYNQHNKVPVTTSQTPGPMPQVHRAPVVVTYGNGNNAALSLHKAPYQRGVAGHASAASAGSLRHGQPTMATVQHGAPSIAMAKGGGASPGGHGKSGK